MAKQELRERARALRKKGLSYKEIKEEVGVSKSTLSLWLKDVVLTSKQKGRLYTKQIKILCLGSKSQKERRAREVNAIIENATREVRLPVSDEAFKLFGAALYWAEGDKKHDFKITNSDPHLVLFIVHWLEKFFQVDRKTLKVSLNIYSQQNDNDLKQFWADLTGIPLRNFGKSYVKPANKGYKKNTLYYGTARIYVPKGINMKHRVYGWIKAVLQNIEGEVELAERRWISLKQTSRPVNLGL